MAKVHKLRATRDLTNANSYVKKGELFDYVGPMPHKYAVPADEKLPAPEPQKAADLKPEAARKNAREKAMNPEGDNPLV